MDPRAQQIPLLEGETDNYDGVTVTMVEPMDAEVFTESLRASLSHWREEVLTIYLRFEFCIVSSLGFSLEFDCVDNLKFLFGK